MVTGLLYVTDRQQQEAQNERKKNTSGFSDIRLFIYSIRIQVLNTCTYPERFTFQYGFYVAKNQEVFDAAFLDNSKLYLSRFAKRLLPLFSTNDKVKKTDDKFESLGGLNTHTHTHTRAHTHLRARVHARTSGHCHGIMQERLQTKYARNL